MKRAFISIITFCASIAASLLQGCQNHDALPKPVNLFVVGTGVVGSSLLDQIAQNDILYRERYGLHIHVIAIANSQKIAYNPGGIKLKNWRDRVTESKEAMNWDIFKEKMMASELSNNIFIDCSSNQAIADSYAALLSSGISVITPNKKANSGSFASFQELQKLSHTGKAKFYYDANVGAGLPIISTIESLVRQGDEIVQIEAVLSGTLSYLFNSYDNGVLFSDLVQNAQKMGYTEPDPRDDLNGMDVARKLLILARVSGFPVEMQDVLVTRFLSDDCFAANTTDEFYQKLKAEDTALSALLLHAQAAGKKLRYIASFKNGTCQISLQAVGPEHPFYHLCANDNCVAITTKNYNKRPLVIQGPGAGAVVTAAKVLDAIVQMYI
jgi:aspartokinase/homoserine dehydrogenase 1